MRSFRRTLPFALLLAPLPLLVACGDDDGPTARSITWNCGTTVTPRPPEAGDPPNVQRLGIGLTCDSPELGDFSGTATQVVTFTDPVTGAFTLTADATYTLSDGTLVTEVTGSGTAAGPAVTFGGTETAVSGTGSYAGVTGDLDYTGSASLVTGTGSVEADGTLTF